MIASEEDCGQEALKKLGANSLSSMLPILRACECSKKLMMAIYLADRDHFLYCSITLKDLLGSHYTPLLTRGWKYWLSLMDRCDKRVVQQQLEAFFSKPLFREILELRYHLKGLRADCVYIRHEILLHRLGNLLVATNYFYDISEKEHIESYFQKEPCSTPSRFAKNPVLSISPREWQVLELIGDGYSSKEIADILFISNHTAVTHRKNLIEKFRVRNTAHLIREAARLVRY